MPVQPSLRRNGFMGCLLGLFLALALVVFLEVTDNTLRSPEDIQEILGTAFLGMLPVIDREEENIPKNVVPVSETVKQTKHRDFYILENPKSMSAECIRSIRTNLLFMSPDRALESMVVTSAIPRR